MIQLSDIRMRDPYVVTYEGKYYLYGTIGEERGEKSLYVSLPCYLPILTLASEAGASVNS